MTESETNELREIKQAYATAHGDSDRALLRLALKMLFFICKRVAQIKP